VKDWSQTLKFESLVFFPQSTAGPVNSNQSIMGPKGITTSTMAHSTRVVPRLTAELFNKQYATQTERTSMFMFGAPAGCSPLILVTSSF